MSNYWKEVVPEIVSYIGIMLTDEQMEQLIDGIEGCVENRWMYSVQPSGPDRKVEEIKRLKHELELEKSKIICPECKGNGRVNNGFVDSSCIRCDGTGKILP